MDLSKIRVNAQVRIGAGCNPAVKGLKADKSMVLPITLTRNL